MDRDEDVHVKGSVSEELFFNLSHGYQELLKTVIPSLNSVEIHAENVEPVRDRASGVATGFSAGVDSYCVLADYYYNDPPSELTVTHLLYNNVGSHSDGGERLFRERFERLRPTAEEIGLPFISVNSNMDKFYNRFSFQQTHTPRNTAVAMLLQGGIGTFLYGSTFDYENISVKPIYDMAYTDPIALPLLSTGGIDSRAVGSEYTRVEKTLNIAGLEDSHDSLDICVRTGSAENCSECWKCRRTLLTLEIAGLLDRYDNIFDMDTYRDGREYYMAEVLASYDPLLEEIVSFAERENFRFPLRSKFLALGVVKPLNTVRSGVDAAASNERLREFIKSHTRGFAVLQ
ncbi:hypothetical protein [Natrialba sp. SSL1]|uniref:hypothetical protein n=1 Tax=Natrialba sp. SSL1 TaxID=1869245 RepID=UPI00111453F8|nr:hypothetical protein [Natrialba sp. SSL1]